MSGGGQCIQQLITQNFQLAQWRVTTMHAQRRIGTRGRINRACQLHIHQRRIKRTDTLLYALQAIHAVQ
jgi:hypothetical protein